MVAKLELVIEPNTLAAHLEHGRVRAALHWGGEPYWYGEDAAGNPDLLDWTWIDLLDFLGKNWASLMLEQGYPLFLANVEHPGRLMARAEERWESMPDDKVIAEEKQILAFYDRHNLAMAMAGANLPMLLWQRTGSRLWLVDENECGQRVDFFSAQQQLEALGEQLAELFSHSKQQAVQQVINQWQRRSEQLQQDYLKYTTGLNQERLEGLVQSVAIALPAANELLQPEPVYLAAARMGRHHLSTREIADVIKKLQHAPATGVKPFVTLVAGAEAVLAQYQDEPAYEQGYQLAQWLRKALGLNDSEYFDPEKLLRDAGVSINETRFDSMQIDAIACWGGIDPLILLNASKATGNRRRTTLAHEICHLLVDRQRALPVAEVLGGEVDDEAEKRANAFAAEILLPRNYSLSVLQKEATVEAALKVLRASHQVSRQLIANQLLNTADSLLKEHERIYLDNLRAGNYPER